MERVYVLVSSFKLLNITFGWFSCIFQSLKQKKTESKLFSFFFVPLKPKVQTNVYSSLARRFFIRLPKTTCSEGVVKVVNPLDALDFNCS